MINTKQCTCSGNVHWSSQHFKFVFGKRAAKVGLDLGVPCPHRKKNPPGCIYCHPYALFPDSHSVPTIKEQISQSAPRLFRRYKTDIFLAYFQNETSTAVPFAKLQTALINSLSTQECVGAIISTRPDYISTKHLEMFATMQQQYKKPIWLELGLQSIHDKTLRLINRGHTYAQFEKAVNLALSFGIDVGVHTILGLPNESIEDMIETHKQISKLGVWSIKIHHLQVLKATALWQMYKDGKIEVFRKLDDYLNVLIEVLSHIPWEIVIQRVFTDAPKNLLIAPIWQENKQDALNKLNKLMNTKNITQGIYNGSVKIFSKK